MKKMIKLFCLLFVIIWLNSVYGQYYKEVAVSFPHLLKYNLYSPGSNEISTADVPILISSPEK